MKQLGASRSVVRQALFQLIAEGCFLSMCRKGKFVAEFSELKDRRTDSDPDRPGADGS